MAARGRGPRGRACLHAGPASARASSPRAATTSSSRGSDASASGPAPRLPSRTHRAAPAPTAAGCRSPRAPRRRVRPAPGPLAPADELPRASARLPGGCGRTGAAGDLLERRDLPRDGRLGIAERAGRGRERARPARPRGAPASRSARSPCHAITHDRCAESRLTHGVHGLAEGMTASRIALVTGANQGLGRALVEGLATRMERTTGSCSPAAIPSASAPPRPRSTRVHATARVEGRVLDVRDGAAIASLAAELGEVDIVFSNAAVAHDPRRTIPPTRSTPSPRPATSPTTTCCAPSRRACARVAG